MIVVIAMLSLLMSAVGVYALGQYTESQQHTARLDVQNAAAALETYRVTYQRYPDPAQGFAPLVATRILKVQPKDPWGQPLTWALRDGEPVVTSWGADEAPGGEGDGADLRSDAPDPQARR
jgi:type II secretion system protein G